jgi:hypothetical protein
MKIVNGISMTMKVEHGNPRVVSCGFLKMATQKIMAWSSARSVVAT